MFWFVLFAIIFWSITFVNTRSLLSDFSALALIFICFGLAWKFWGHTPKTIGFSRFSVLTWLGGSCGAQAKGRVRRGWEDWPREEVTTAFLKMWW